MTAAARAQLAVVQRHHRASRRQGDIPSQTPPLASIIAALNLPHSTTSLPPSPPPIHFSVDPPFTPGDPSTFINPALNPHDFNLLNTFDRRLAALHKSRCTECDVFWFDVDVVDGVCRKCRSDIAAHRVPLFGAENDMAPGQVDPSLPTLSQVEKMLIARVHVYVEVRQIRGQQYRYSGNVVNFHRDTATLCHELPHLPRDLDILLLNPSNTNASHRLQRQFARDHRVRRSHVVT